MMKPVFAIDGVADFNNQPDDVTLIHKADGSSVIQYPDGRRFRVVNTDILTTEWVLGNDVYANRYPLEQIVHLTPLDPPAPANPWEGLPDGRYFDGTYEWDFEDGEWTPLRAPSGMPSEPQREGLQRVITTRVPIDQPSDPESGQKWYTALGEAWGAYYRPGMESRETEAFKAAWKARGEADRAAVRSVDLWGRADEAAHLSIAAIAALDES